MSSQHDHIFNLQVQGDKYARLLLTEKARTDRYQKQVKKFDKELQRLRLQRKQANSRGGGVNAVKSCLDSEAQLVAKLENQLNAKRRRESTMIAENEKLKRDVDALRAARVLSQTIYEKNQKRLRELQRAMQQVFEESNIVMAERDTVLAQMHTLSALNKQEQTNFDQVYEKLMSIITTEKENAANYRKSVLTLDSMEEDDSGYQRGNLGMDEEKDLKQAVVEYAQEVKQEQQHIATLNERLHVYEDTITKLSTIMEIPDRTKLLDAFMRSEEENFAIYRYIQNVNNEIEQLEEQKLIIDQEYQTYAKELQEGTAFTRKRMLEHLEETKRQTLKEQECYDAKRKTSLQKFIPIARAIDKLFISLGCSDAVQTAMGSTALPSSPEKSQQQDGTQSMSRQPSMDELFASHGVTESNILQFLGIIESRCCEIIQQFSRRLAAKGDIPVPAIGDHLRQTNGARAISNVKNFLPDAHTALDEDQNNASDEEESERPMSREELKRRAINAVNSSQALQTITKAQPTRSKLPNTRKKK